MTDTIERAIERAGWTTGEEAEPGRDGAAPDKNVAALPAWSLTHVHGAGHGAGHGGHTG
ncbi:hypothetical protein SGFS_033710 [Streptomyces graminofaciens]|uniref:Uncharacterized protein n=1 Tax=Streptomyces graminofaciens TaxID=68212 RepID=A0ABM7F812_9ACTN|nr:hypothetical protein [Streptomyces graminofaciens]BBC32077.1 hypothetical protein SGFS_033710 [Streptomyces graminofaciens]